MTRENLTIERIKSFSCSSDKQQDFLRDKEVKQLAVRATSNGAKSYVFEGKLSGQSVRITLGSVETMLLSCKNPRGAREIARHYQTLIDEGRDPRQVKAERTAADKAARKEAKRKDATGLEAWAAYLEDRTPHWGERHVLDHIDVAREGGEKITRGLRKGMKKRKEAGILRPILTLPMNQVTEDIVRDWLKDNNKKRPTRTRLALSFLSTFFRWCEESKDYRGSVSDETLKACAKEKRKLPQPSARTDCLQREQLPVWFDHVKRLPPIMSAYLQIGLLTGARREELAGLRWDNVDFAWNSMTIRDKVEGQRTIPLTPYVKTLLLSLQNLNQQEPTVRYMKTLTKRGEEWTPSEFVFFSRISKSGRITEPNIALTKVTNAAGLPSVSMHGLRRSFKSLSEWVEMPTGVVAQIMGHKPSATAEKHYTVRPLDLLRLWHSKYEGWLLEQGGIEQPNAGEAAKTKLTVVSANA